MFVSASPASSFANPRFAPVAACKAPSATHQQREGIVFQQKASNGVSKALGHLGNAHEPLINTANFIDTLFKRLQEYKSPFVLLNSSVKREGLLRNKKHLLLTLGLPNNSKSDLTCTFSEALKKIPLDLQYHYGPNYHIVTIWIPLSPNFNNNLRPELSSSDRVKHSIDSSAVDITKLQLSVYNRVINSLEALLTALQEKENEVINARKKIKGLRSKVIGYLNSTGAAG